MNRTISVGIALALAATPGAARTGLEKVKVTVDFENLLEGVVKGSTREKLQFKQDVGVDLATSLDDKIGFLDLSPGADGDQDYHLRIELEPNEQDSNGSGFSYFEFVLSSAEGELGSVREKFVEPEILAEYVHRSDVRERIKAEFEKRLPEYRDAIVRELFARIPIRSKGVELGYWIDEYGTGFVSIPLLYSDLEAQFETEFEARLGRERVTINALYSDDIDDRSTVDENLRKVTRSAKPEQGWADYWAAKEVHRIVCSVEPSELPGVAEDAKETGDKTRPARLYVSNYKHKKWPLKDSGAKRKKDAQ
jgi:hypothetical protein